MPEFIPRTLVVFTALIAAIALFVGIRDYVATKHKAQPTAATAQNIVQPNAGTARKKATAKKGRAQPSAAETTAAVADAAWDTAGKSLIKDVLMKVEPAPNGQRSAEVQPVLNEASSRSSSRSCAPLPNSTRPEDVDAIYYQGWAREYGCGLD